jgi:hypothetical protein
MIVEMKRERPFRGADHLRPIIMLEDIELGIEKAFSGLNWD